MPTPETNLSAQANFRSYLDETEPLPSAFIREEIQGIGLGLDEDEDGNFVLIAYNPGDDGEIIVSMGFTREQMRELLAIVK